MKILVLTFLKRSNFEAFFRPSTLKTEIFFQQNLMVAYVHIEYSTCQFSEESEERVLAVPKKRGPERVKRYNITLNYFFNNKYSIKYSKYSISISPMFDLI